MKPTVTTPVCIVYDCSCRRSSTSPSLDHCLVAGPPLVNDLTRILLQFRLSQYRLTTEVKKAFLHVGLDEAERDFTWFFWLEDITDPLGPMKMYRFRAVFFGAQSSPYILLRGVLKHLASHPLPCGWTFRDSLNVGNSVVSLPGDENALSFFHDVRPLLLEAVFNLRSWVPNCTSVSTTAVADDVTDPRPLVSVLGLMWSPNSERTQCLPFLNSQCLPFLNSQCLPFLKDAMSAVSEFGDHMRPRTDTSGHLLGC